MNRWVLLIMIVLLPLRGWAGELMGLQMALGTAVAPAARAMPADCPMHAQAATTRSADADAGADTRTDTRTDTQATTPPGGDACKACDLCLPMAEVTAQPLAVAACSAQAAPVMAPVSFVSAALAPARRPPIS